MYRTIRRSSLTQTRSSCCDAKETIKRTSRLILGRGSTHENGNLFQNPIQTVSCTHMYVSASATLKTDREGAMPANGVMIISIIACGRDKGNTVTTGDLFLQNHESMTELRHTDRKSMSSPQLGDIQVRDWLPAVRMTRPVCDTRTAGSKSCD